MRTHQGMSKEPASSLQDVPPLLDKQKDGHGLWQRQEPNPPHPVPHAYKHHRGGSEQRTAHPAPSLGTLGAALGGCRGHSGRREEGCMRDPHAGQARDGPPKSLLPEGGWVRSPRLLCGLCKPLGCGPQFLQEPSHLLPRQNLFTPTANNIVIHIAGDRGHSEPHTVTP